ncbi:MAG: phage envelope protein [Cytophagaceae bacterium]|nr:phage envelope protein [Cytophagaceae bacterium]
MFTVEQIKEELSRMKSGADFPVLAMKLKNLGVTYYETKIEDGSSIFHGKNGYELSVGANYTPMAIADKVNIEQLKTDIENHQQGKSDYFQISRQSADNGIGKWAVCLISMTCTYMDKAGNNVWVEHIPDVSIQKSVFTVEEIKMAHSKVKSGADFPAYIKEIKSLGVTHYEAYVSDGHIDYHGADDYTAKVPAKYEPLYIADALKSQEFKAELLAHQQGKTDFLTFIKMCATYGIERWAIRIDEMTCTYYDKAGNEILVEKIPQ